MQFTSVNVLCENVYFITLTTQIKLDKTDYRLVITVISEV